MPYNLMVTWKGRPWRDGVHVWQKDRVFEQSDPKLIESIGGIENPKFGIVKEWPVLFLYEKPSDEPVKIGHLSDITSRNNEVRIHFTVLEAPYVLDPKQIEHLYWDLGLSEYSFSRTHWAIKDVDLFDVISRKLNITNSMAIAAIDKFTDDDTLEELISAITRDVQDRSYRSTLDRLHTYCSKKFTQLLDQRGESVSRDEPLHSKAGKYLKIVSKEKQLSDVSQQVIKNSVAVLEKFNFVRNNRTLTHDNLLLPNDEAEFIFDSIISMLKFIRAIEVEKFGR
jgi:Abortive infection C-terminus